MLRGHPQFKIFAAIFFKAERHRDGRLERDAGISATRRGGNNERRKKAACRAVSAWRRGWVEYCCAVWRGELLPHAAFDCDFPAAKRRLQRGRRPRRIFRTAPESCAASAVIPKKRACHRSCGGFTGSDAFAF